MSGVSELINAELKAKYNPEGSVIRQSQQAALEIFEGKWSEAFPLEIFQTGGCTPINMNVNHSVGR